MKLTTMRAQQVLATISGDTEKAERLKKAIKQKKNEQEKPRPLGGNFEQMIKKFNNK